MPSITFVQVQTVLGRRVGPWVALADLHESTFTTLVMMGFSPANPAQVLDADLAAVTIDQLPELFDVAHWRALESIDSNLTESGLRAIGVMDDFDRARLQIRERTDRIYSRIQRAYGIGLPTLAVGVVASNFQQQDDVGTIDY